MAFGYERKASSLSIESTLAYQILRSHMIPSKVKRYLNYERKIKYSSKLNVCIS